ncbi:hypothetical protein QTI51_24620 [Variovorax sp. J22G73]|uniref:hypothetical protein n=1 Tax=unclassified Variovorax TaxID=663243 RepID=UPI0025779CC5|nr:MULTISPECIES: hypothetical protein [unclassified Variovorax]MDM0007893.1 hypothetical protein [Variovorax sp. J22R203]MDM0100484.1 hypothetical protein [Variovorax sp. J22G73]
MKSDKNGGAGAQSSSQSKEPWAPAQPWLLSNVVQGQALQDKYTAQPFSPQQQAAYDNSYAQSDYMRGLVPSLLNQLQGQPVGFDPSNPTARPKAWDWNALANGALGQQSVRNATAPAAAPATSPLSQFMQQSDVLSGATMSGMGSGGLLGTGGYGSFKYGMAMPQPGTQAYRDMSDYFNNGGADPNNLYGRQASAYQVPPANPLSRLWTSGGLLGAGAPGEAEGPASGAPGGAASAGPGGTF